MPRLPRKRHMKHSDFARRARSKRLRAWLAQKSLELDSTATTFAFTTDAPSAEITVTAHGFEVGSGPLIVMSDGDLPAGMTFGQFYWVSEVVDANTVVLTTKRGSQVPFVPQDDGTGGHEIAAAEDVPGIYEYLRQNAPEVVRDATNADPLANVELLD